MIIDSNMHWLPENLFTDKSLLNSFLRVIPGSHGEYGKLTTVPGKKDRQQIVIEKPKGYEVLNYADNQYSAKDQIKDMDEAKVDKSILRIPCWQEWLDLEMCKKLNDGMAKYVRENSDRFLALAVLPPWGDKECLDELARCMDLGFCGVQLAAHYGTLYLDEEPFSPYFKELDRLNVPVVVHHTPLPVDYNSIYKYTNLRRQYGRCIDQATAVGRELFSGLFDEFPNLRVIHSMLGGGFFAYTNMLVFQKSGIKDEVERFETAADKFKQYLDRNVFFDMSGAVQWGKPQLECAIKVFGADHILFGSSYPVRREWMLKGVEYVQSLDIGAKEKSLILSENAMRLFKIKG